MTKRPLIMVARSGVPQSRCLLASRFRRLAARCLHCCRQLPRRGTQVRKLRLGAAQLAGLQVRAEGAAHLDRPAGAKPLLKLVGVFRVDGREQTPGPKAEIVQRVLEFLQPGRVEVPSSNLGVEST